MDNPRKVKYTRIVFWIFLCGIVLQAILPINGANSRFNHTFIVYIRLDYLVHVALFFSLSVLFWLAYFREGPVNFSKSLLFLAVVFPTAFMAEAIQWLVPYRVFNINDLVANAVGVIISIPLLKNLSIVNRKNGGYHYQR
jgi:VanZ family protein